MKTSPRTAAVTWSPGPRTGSRRRLSPAPGRPRRRSWWAARLRRDRPGCRPRASTGQSTWWRTTRSSGRPRYLARAAFRAQARSVGSTIELGTPAAVSLVDVANDETSWLVSYVADALRWQVVAADGTLGGYGSVDGTFGGFTTDPGQPPVCDGERRRFHAVHDQGAALFAARIAASGTLVSSATPTLTGDVFEVAVARGGASDYVAFVSATPNAVTAPARGSHLDASLRFDASPLVLSFHANDQDAPRAAFNGTDYLVVWEDLRGSPECGCGGALAGPACWHGLRTAISPSGQALGSSTLRSRPRGASADARRGVERHGLPRGLEGGRRRGRSLRPARDRGRRGRRHERHPDRRRLRRETLPRGGVERHRLLRGLERRHEGDSRRALLANGTLPERPPATSRPAPSCISTIRRSHSERTSYLVVWGEYDDVKATRVAPRPARFWTRRASGARTRAPVSIDRRWRRTARSGSSPGIRAARSGRRASLPTDDQRSERDHDRLGERHPARCFGGVGGQLLLGHLVGPQQHHRRQAGHGGRRRHGCDRHPDHERDVLPVERPDRRRGGGRRRPGAVPVPAVRACTQRSVARVRTNRSFAGGRRRQRRVDGRGWCCGKRWHGRRDGRGRNQRYRRRERRFDGGRIRGRGSRWRGRRERRFDGGRIRAGGRGGTDGGTGGGAAGGSAITDAGAEAGSGGSPSDAGCGCRYSPGSSTLGPLGYVLLGLWLRRRTRRAAPRAVASDGLCAAAERGTS